MKLALRLLLTLTTILCGTTLASATVLESRAEFEYEKTCMHEGEVGLSDDFIAPGRPLAAAEAELGADLVSLAKVKHKPAVVVGAVDPATGRAVAGRSFKGYCAEREAADALGVGDRAIQFTKPVRPRTGEVIPVCKECQKQFDRSQFPEGTPFDD